MASYRFHWPTSYLQQIAAQHHGYFLDLFIAAYFAAFNKKSQELELKKKLKQSVNSEKRGAKAGW